MKPLSPILGALAIVGCVTTAPVSLERATVTIVFDQSAYAPGDTAAVVITNHTGEDALFALLCDLSWEGRSEDEWEMVRQPDCSAVRVRPTRLAGGEDMVTDVVVEPCDPEMLSTYVAFRARLRFQFADGGGYVTVYSGDLAISSP